MIGQYGPALVVEDYRIPVGYLIAVATGGPNSTLNPLGFREDSRAGLQGLQLLGRQGGNVDYPLMDSFYFRMFGTGARHRGAAAVLKVTDPGDTTYTAPVWVR